MDFRFVKSILTRRLAACFQTMALIGEKSRRMYSLSSVIQTMQASQIARHFLPQYQLRFSHSDKGIQASGYNQWLEKKEVPIDAEESMKKDNPNDSFLLSLVSKVTFSIETLAFLHQLRDFKWSTVKEWKRRQEEELKIQDQRFIYERLKILGSDLAAAHFIVHRDGAVKFKDQDNWIRKENGKYILPSKFVPNLYLEAIDASRTGLLYEGFQNLEHLYYLQSLNLSYCNNVDDWCLDRLHIFKETLEHLDVSGCPNITERGLTCLYRLRKLKTLNLANLPNVSHLQLVSILLEDALPQCQIFGVDFSDVEIEDQKDSDTAICDNKKVQRFQS